MKKLLLILSALLFITGCEVESASNAIDDKYSDGIYFFVANCGIRSDVTQIMIEYCYNKPVGHVDTYYINLRESNVSEIIKINIDELKIINVKYSYKSGNNTYNSGSPLANLNKESFENKKDGLYVLEFFLEGAHTDGYLRKTKSIDYYLNCENFYDKKNVLFIKNVTNKDINLKYRKFKEDEELQSFPVHKNEIKSIILYNPPRTQRLEPHGEYYYLDCSELKSNTDSIDLSKLKKGYFYTEIDSEGNFTTPVKLNSYKDIINN